MPTSPSKSIILTSIGTNGVSALDLTKAPPRVLADMALAVLQLLAEIDNDNIAFTGQGESAIDELTASAGALHALYKPVVPGLEDIRDYGLTVADDHRGYPVLRDGYITLVKAPDLTELEKAAVRMQLQFYSNQPDETAASFRDRLAQFDQEISEIPEVPLRTKPELLIHLAIGCYEANPDVPDSMERMRKGFDAIVAELHKLDFVPKADIADFVKLVESKSGFDELLVPCTLFATVLPDEVFYAALAESGMFDGMAESSPGGQLLPPHHPKFVEAMALLKDLMDKHGEAAMKLPEYRTLWSQAWQFAPPLFLEAARQIADESGLVPPTELVDDNGRPVYTAEAIAKHLGVPVEQILDDLDRIPGVNLHTGPTHKVQ